VTVEEDTLRRKRIALIAESVAGAAVPNKSRPQTPPFMNNAFATLLK
jgi:hypothetical protein